MRKFIEKINMRPKNIKAFLMGLGLLGIYFLLLGLVTSGVYQKIDLALTIWLQSAVPHVLDVPLSIFSLIGSFEITLSILLVISYLYFRKTKKIPYSFMLFLTILLFEFMGKYLVYHPGPPSYFFRYSIPFAFPSGYVHTNYSFPSGHVSRTLFISIIAIFVLTRVHESKKYFNMLIILAVLISLMMIISRVYLGEHWTSDVLGGLILGSAIGSFALIYY